MPYKTQGICIHCGEPIERGQMSYNEWCSKLFCSRECKGCYYNPHNKVYMTKIIDFTAFLFEIADDDDDECLSVSHL